jgi:hypothetical protein
MVMQSENSLCVVPNRRPRGKRQVLLIPIICATYLISFFLPVITIRDLGVHMLGVEIVCGCLSEKEYFLFTWSALSPNMLLWFGIAALSLKQWSAAGLFGLMAITGGIVVAVLVSIEHSDNHVHLQIGYYTWIISMALLIFSAVRRIR